MPKAKGRQLFPGRHELDSQNTSGFEMRPRPETSENPSEAQMLWGGGEGHILGVGGL